MSINLDDIVILNTNGVDYHSNIKVNKSVYIANLGSAIAHIFWEYALLFLVDNMDKRRE